MILVRICILLLATLLGVAFCAAADSPVGISGEGVSEKLKSQIEAQLPDEEDPSSIFEARRQVKRAGKRISDYLNSRGYFAAEVSETVTVGPPIIGELQITPGKRFKIGKVTIEIDAPEEVADAIVASASVQTGDRALPDRIRAAEAALLVQVREQGFAFAETEEMTVLGDREAGTIDLVFNIKPGPRVQFGEVIYKGQTRTRQSFNDKLIPFETGERYTPGQLGLFNSRLAETRLYTLSSASLAKTPSRVADNGDAIHDVIVNLTERKRNTITAGASYSTAEGPGVVVDFVQRNTIRRGDVLSIRTTAAQQEQSVRVDWDLPHVLGYGRALNGHVGVGREDTEAFERNAILLGLNINIKRKEHVSYIFGVASETSNEIDANGERNLQTFSASGAIALDYSNDLLDPTKGWRADVRVEPGIIVGDEQDQFLSTTAQASFYQPLWKEDKLVLATRARAGAIFGAPTLSLPTSRRFFAGGGGSARGFGFQEVGPRDADNTPIGGRGLLEVTGELRYRVNEKYGFAVFADAASVVDEARPSFDDLRYGVGAGVRYYTGFGPIRLDVALPLNRQPGDGAFQVYISIGQAF